MRIADILRTKGSAVHTVPPVLPVGELVAALGERNIGAAVVLDGETVVGVVSERDVMRGLDEHGPQLLQRAVEEIMSAPVATCVPEDSVNSVMQTMTDRRFRHVPVLIDGRLGGIVSIGDTVSARMRELETEREQLESYIASG